MIFNKLVRDKIDEIINNNGKGEKAIIRILEDNEYQEALNNKLVEELKELQEAISLGNTASIIEESADVLEVIKAINGDNLDKVISVMNQKRESRGGFKERKFLERVEKEIK